MSTVLIRKGNSQKQITFTPKQLQLESSGCQNKLTKFVEGMEKAWNELSKPAVKVAAPFIGMAVGAKL